MAPSTPQKWPWRVHVLQAEATAQIIAIFSAYLLLRFQFSKTLAPILGYSDKPSRGRFAAAGAMGREVAVRNGGGVVVVDSVLYCVDSKLNPTEGRLWEDESSLRRHLDGKGLVDQRDFHIESIGQGAPLSIASNAPTGELLLAEFGDKAVREIQGFDIRLRVRDGLGDVHERIFRVLQSHDCSAAAQPVYKTWRGLTKALTFRLRPTDLMVRILVERVNERT